jgi:hypothetical protein
VLNAPELAEERADPFIYFANVIRGNIPMAQWDPSAPATNEMVVRILEAARESARSGKTIIWKEYYKE